MCGLKKLPLVNGVWCIACAPEIDLPDVRSIWTGCAVAAKLDYSQPMVNAPIARQYVWDGSGTRSVDTSDRYGDGTHVSGILPDNGANSPGSGYTVWGNSRGGSGETGSQATQAAGINGEN
jgi:hypothetical protein